MSNVKHLLYPLKVSQSFNGTLYVLDGNGSPLFHIEWKELADEIVKLMNNKYHQTQEGKG